MFGNPPSGSYSNQPQLDSVNLNQKRGNGPAKSKRPGKNQKKDWFKQSQNAKGKGKAANEVSFANEVVVELALEYVKEDFLPPSFSQMQEDYDMEDLSSTIVHVDWNEEDSGMNVAGLSLMPFQHGSLRNVLSEGAIATSGTSTPMKKKKQKKKVSFTLGGLASLSSYFDNIGLLNETHIQALLPSMPEAVAMATPQDIGEHLQHYDDSVIYRYDNKYDGLDCYHCAFALREDSDKCFTQHH